MSDTDHSQNSETVFDAATQRRAIRGRYARGATRAADGDCCASDGCCSDSSPSPETTRTAELFGSSPDQPDSVAADANLGLGCGTPRALAPRVANVSRIGRLEAMLHDAGLDRVEIEPRGDSDRFVRDWDAVRDPSEFLASATTTGRKPTAPDREA